MRTQSRTAKTIILSLGKGFGAVSGLLSMMVLVRLFSKEDFATFRQALLVLAMAAPFLGMGLSRSVIYHIPTAAKNRRGAILFEALIPLSISGLSYYLFIVFGGNQLFAYLFGNPRLEHVLMIVAPIAFLSLVRAPLSPALIATHKVFLAASFGVVSGISVALVSTVVAVFIPIVEVVLFIRLALTVVICVVGLVILFKNFSFERPTFNGIAEQLAFGLPLCLSAAVTVVSKNMDRVMVSSLCSLNEFAVFDRGAIELPLIGIVTGSMTTVLLVDYRTLFPAGRTDEMLRLVHRSVEKSSMILMPAMCFLFVFAPQFMTCMFGKAYEESYTVFRIYLLLLPNRTIVFGTIAMAAGKTQELAIASVCALLANVVLSYIAIRLFGYIGGAISTVIVIYFVSGFLRATIAKNVLNCSMFEFLPIAIVLRAIWISLIPLVPISVFLFFIGDVADVVKLLSGAALYFTGLMLVYWKLGYVSPGMLRRYFWRLRK